MKCEKCINMQMTSKEFKECLNLGSPSANECVRSV